MAMKKTLTEGDQEIVVMMMKKIGWSVLVLVVAVTLVLIVDKVAGIKLTENIGFWKAIIHNSAQGISGIIIYLGIAFFFKE